MITTLGKKHILSYIAGLAPSIGQSIAIGVGTAPASLNDTALALEVDRVPVTSVSIDPVTNKVVFKGTIPPGVDIAISEMGLWFSEGDADSYLVATFDDFQEPWMGGEAVASTISRFGNTLYNLPISGTTEASASLQLNALDMSGFFGPRDVWTIGLYKTGAAYVSVTLRLFSGTSGSDYADIQFFPSSPPATGYIVASALSGNATVVGDFNPSAVTEYKVIVKPQSGNSISGSVGLDVINATNAIDDREGSILVARSNITTFKTSAATPTDVEYELGVAL